MLWQKGSLTVWSPYHQAHHRQRSTGSLWNSSKAAQVTASHNRSQLSMRLKPPSACQMWSQPQHWEKQQAVFLQTSSEGDLFLSDHWGWARWDVTAALIHHKDGVNRLVRLQGFQQLPMCEKTPSDSAGGRQSNCGKVSFCFTKMSGMCVCLIVNLNFICSK